MLCYCVVYFFIKYQFFSVWNIFLLLSLFYIIIIIIIIIIVDLGSELYNDGGVVSSSSIWSFFVDW